MGTKSSLSILFYLRNDKANRNGEAPIYMRIIVDGKRSAVTTNRSIEKSKWNNEAGRAKGTKEEIRELNLYLDRLKGSVLTKQRELFEKGKTITAETIKNALLGKDSKRHTLMEAFKYHNQQMAQKVGTDFSPATLTRYETTLSHIQTFLKKVYKVSDIYLDELDFKFITDLEHYFKTKEEGKCNHNSTLKYIRNFRKIVNLAVGYNWMDKDPFGNFKRTLQDSKRQYLSKEELSAIEKKVFTIKRLDEARDVFVFCCYTGLAYADVAKLKHEDIRIGIDGKKWIFSYRQKTDTKSNIPLLPKALEILEKYSTDSDCIYNSTLLPVRSNQRMNSYLKEIADVCNVDSELTTHMARHTFSTIITLANGLPIETLSTILGHKSVRTTQIYGKIIDTKVGADMTDVEKKLGSKIG